MASSQSLSQNQQQQLKLSPQQVRFGRILEMSAPEYEEEVQRMLEENPALEVQSDFADNAETDRDDEGRPFTESADELQRADYGSDEDVPYYRTHISNWSADDSFYEPEAIDNGTNGVISLENQLAELHLEPELREVARYVIGNLDSNGYLTRSAEAIADDIAMGAGYTVSPLLVRRAIEVVRQLDPAGVGASDLRDCLLLQLDRMPDEPQVTAARKILRDYFDLFSKKHFDRIKAALKLTDRDFDEVLKLIRSLNPKPGALLETVSADDRMSHITPDFHVDVDPEGNVQWALTSKMRELGVNSAFDIAKFDTPRERKFMSKSELESLPYIRERHDAAVEFIDMAHRREHTLELVMDAIVQLQYAFFRTGDRSKLKPMVLRDVRKLTGLDLSVISRATASKYVLTPTGMVSLKSLFSESVNDEGDISSHQIESTIRQVIEHEDKTHPLSDAAICDKLTEKGLNVARRTVTKYRERMGIPVARLRRN